MAKSKSKDKYRDNKRKGKDEKFDASDFQSQEGTNPKYKDSRKGPKGKGRNNANFWNKHPELVQSAGSLPFAMALGQPLDWDAAGTVALATSTNYGLPGIAAIRTALTYGTATDTGSSLNIAARNLYTFIRHMNSGHTNYDASNLMIYFIALDNAFALYSYALRAYGTLLNYKVLNRYTPEFLLESTGLDASNMKANMAQILFDLQNWAYRLSSFKIPSNVDVFKRHFEMFQSWYKDSENDEKAQIYGFYPHFILAWDEPNVQFTPVLDFRETLHMDTGNVAYPSTITWSTLRTAMNNAINAIATSEDFNIMSGDIVKAYGAENCWTIPAPDAGYVAIPLFNWEMLVQIHNMSVLSVPKLDYESGTPTGNDATIANWFNSTAFFPQEIIDPVTQTSWLVMTAAEAIYGSNTDADERYVPAVLANLLDVPFKLPTPDDVMNATRLTVNSGYAEDAKYRSATPSVSPLTLGFLSSYGTEVVTGLFVVKTFFSHPTPHGDYIRSGIQKSAFAQRVYKGGNPVSWDQTHFTLFPLYYQITAATTLSGSGILDDVYIGNVFGDIDNCTILSPNTLDNLHTAAIMSAFNIPANATNK